MNKEILTTFAREIARKILTRELSGRYVHEKTVEDFFQIPRSEARSVLRVVSDEFGLVHTKGYGFRIAMPEKAEVLHMIARRYLLEAHAAQELAVLCCDMQPLEQNLLRMARIPDDDKPEIRFDVMMADAEFHGLLLLAMGAEEDAALLRRYFFRIVLAVPGYFDGLDVKSILQEHDNIVHAVKSLDHDAILNSVQSHFSRASKRWPFITDGYLQKRVFRSLVPEKEMAHSSAVAGV